MSRRVPAPWWVEKIPSGYVVRDVNGQILAHIYSRATEVDAPQAKVLTEDEARIVAISIAQLPRLLGCTRYELPLLAYRSFRNARSPLAPADEERPGANPSNVRRQRSGS
jgi:hypothetical protein